MVTAHPSAFGSLLKRYRLAAQLTQEELAERARLSARAVSDLERGVRRTPYRDTVQRLADALELEADERAALGAAARRAADGVELSAEEQAAPLSPTNLPPEPTSFIGREREIAAISELLMQPTIRLVTLTGPGGIGKTRLGLHLAARLVDRHPSGHPNGGAVGYPDGVFFVSLASIGDPALIPSAIAGALDVKERGGQSLVSTLIEHLRTRRLLLVLDNLEHLLDARSLLAELLEACPTLRMLVTSRTVLHLSWEHTFEVPPLGLPDTAHGVDRQDLCESEAVTLLIDRARAVKSNFAITDENAEAVAQICRYLEGMPLAIELAAARLRLFPPQALVGRLSQRLRFLTGGAHDLPARHQTLRSAIDWSYSLLSEEEKRIFARLSVFRGGCSLEAAEAVCNAEGDLGVEVLDGVASLVEKSLLRQEGEEEPRFVMLETIREYAQERLEETGACEEPNQEHTRYYLALAEEAASRLDGPKQASWLGRLEIEHDNLRAGLRWARDIGRVDLGLRLAVALSGFWAVRGPLSEGRRWLEDLAAAEGGSAALQAAALAAAGEFASVEGHRREAAELFQQSLVLYRGLGDQRGSAEAVGQLVVACYLAGEVERAVDLLRESEIQGRETGDQMLLAVSLRLQAAMAASQGDVRKAQNLGEESLALYRGLEDSEGIPDVLQILAGAAYGAGDRQRARALTDDLLAILRRSPLDPERGEWLEILAYRARSLGDYEYATHFLEELVARAEEVGDRRVAARARGGLGLLAREQGDYHRGAALYGESLTVLREVGDLLGISRALVGLSDVARDQGDAARVVELCEESLSLETGDVVHTAYARHNLGLAAWYQGNRDRAESLFAESLNVFKTQRRAVDAVEVLSSIGLLALDQGQYDRAGEVFADCLVTARKSESRWIVGTLLEGRAGGAALRSSRGGAPCDRHPQTACSPEPL